MACHPLKFLLWSSSSHPSAEEQSTPSFSSIDGGLEPFPTADYHLTGYQDPPEDNKYTTGEQGSLSSRFPPPLSWNRYITNSLTGLLSDRRSTWPRKLNCWPDSFNKGSCYCEAAHGSIWYADDSPDVQYISIAGYVKFASWLARFPRKSMPALEQQETSPFWTGKWKVVKRLKSEVGSWKSKVRSHSIRSRKWEVGLKFVT